MATSIAVLPKEKTIYYCSVLQCSNHFQLTVEQYYCVHTGQHHEEEML